MVSIKHFLSIADLNKGQLITLPDSAIRIKKVPFSKQSRILRNKIMAMIFEKPFLKTRVAFETGMAQLGGHAFIIHDMLAYRGNEVFPYVLDGPKSVIID